MAIRHQSSMALAFMPETYLNAAMHQFSQMSARSGGLQALLMDGLFPS